MNARQLFFALMKSENTPSLFKKDHKTDPVHLGLNWFIKDLHEFEGVQQTYDFDEVQEHINDGFANGSLITAMVGGLTDKYFRDGNH